jgi:hypothetical protein
MKDRLGGVITTSFTALLRLLQLVHYHLHEKSSSHKEAETGIFSLVEIYPDKPVAYFNRQVVTESTYTSSGNMQAFVKLPKGSPPFYVQYNSDLDRSCCFAHKAANLPFKEDIAHLINCKLSVDPKSNEAFIYAVQFIPKDTEIVWLLTFNLV